MNRQAGLEDAITFHEADGIKMPFEDNTFDAAWFLESILHMETHKKALQEVARVLKPGGFLLYTDGTLRAPLPPEDKELFEKLMFVRSLIYMPDHPTLLSETGFELLSLNNYSDNCNLTLQRTVDEIELYRDQVLEVGGEDFYSFLQTINQKVADAWIKNVYYVVVTAQLKL